MVTDSIEARTALATGSARGSVRPIARVLARDGNRTAVNHGKNERAVRETLELQETGADVSRKHDANRMMDRVRTELGPIELLVNIAVIGESIDHLKFTFESWRQIFEVNADGRLLTTKAVEDEMIGRRSGRITNLSSLSGLIRT